VSEWTGDGHGSGSGGDLDNSTSSDRGGCDFCHIDNIWTDHVPVKSVSNPYRLRTTATANTVCLACHDTGDAGFDPPGGTVGAVNSSVNVDTAHFGSKHSAGEGGGFCWDCHDPHGVPTNILMVKTQVSKSADSYGVPAVAVTVQSAFSWYLPGVSRQRGRFR
jgi:hypothetical protein